MRKLLLPAAALILIGVGAIFLLVFPLITPPRFITTNLSDEDFVLTVHWRDQSMTLGHVQARRQLEFRLNYEPPVTFTVLFSDGITWNSEPVSFSRGEVVHIQVSEKTIEVDRDN